MKICNKCGNEKTIVMFSKNKYSKDGFQNMCKQCCKQYREDNKEYFTQYRINNKIAREKYLKDNNKHIIVKNKQYREENKAELIEKNKQFRKNNKKYFKQYLNENKEHIKERSSKYYGIYYTNNKDKISSDAKIWVKNNPDKVNNIQQKRRARKLLLISTFTNNQWDEVKQYFNNTCCYCGKELLLTREHFIPVSKLGEYTSNNIIPCCQSCNSSKRDRDFFEWYPKFKHYSKKREKIILEYLHYKNNMQQISLTV